jgi:hypothetical protein
MNAMLNIEKKIENACPGKLEDGHAVLWGAHHSSTRRHCPQRVGAARSVHGGCSCCAMHKEGKKRFFKNNGWEERRGKNRNCSIKAASADCRCRPTILAALVNIITLKQNCTGYLVWVYQRKPKAWGKVRAQKLNSCTCSCMFSHHVHMLSVLKGGWGGGGGGAAYTPPSPAAPNAPAGPILLTESLSIAIVAVLAI